MNMLLANKRNGHSGKVTSYTLNHGMGEAKPPPRCIPKVPLLCSARRRKSLPFQALVPFPFLVLLEMRSWVAGCEDLMAMAQEEEPTLASYPGHLPNLLMLLLGQMLSIYYLSWALKSIEDISSI